MTTQENKTELLEKLNPCIEFASKSLLAGTLKKNVIKHFTNIGFTYLAAENIAELGGVRAKNFTHYKLK